MLGGHFSILIFEIFKRYFLLILNLLNEKIDFYSSYFMLNIVLRPRYYKVS